jgi:hypothetical protein
MPINEIPPVGNPKLPTLNADKQPVLTEQPTEKTIVDNIKNLYSKSRSAVDSKHSKDRKNLDYYLGKHWSFQRPKWKSSPVTNFVYSNIEQLLPLMTDSNPKIEIVAQTPEGKIGAELMSVVVDDVWDKTDMRRKMPDWCKNSLIYGSGIAKPYWDATINNGIGDIRIDIIDNFHFFPDPDASEIEDARWLITAIPTPIDEVRRRYPDSKDRVKKDSQVSGPRLTTHIGRAADDKGSRGPDWARGQENKPTESRVTVIECWYHDPTLVEAPTYTPEEDQLMWQTMGHSMQDHLAAQGMPATELVPLYPNGRVTVIAGDIILSDKPNPFMHGRFPFVKLDDQPRQGEFWAMGDVEQIIPLQNEFNKRQAQMLDSLNLTANPVWVIDKNAGVDISKLVNRSGSVIRKNPGTEVRREPGPEVPSSAFKALEQTQMNIETVSGVHDVTQGRKPAGITAASSISQLQEAAQTRVRPKVRLLEHAIRELGHFVVELIQQFYTWERVVPQIGPSKVQQWVQFDPKYVQDTFFTVQIEANSTMPVSRVSRAADAIQLFQLGVIDQIALLEATDWPERYEVYQRMQESQQAQIEAEQQAAEDEFQRELILQDLKNKGKSKD